MTQQRVGVGVGVMILRNGNILLGKRHDDPEKASSLLRGAGTWTMPGGKLDFRESFEDAAKRETMEETGMTLKTIKVIGINNDVVEEAHFVTIGFLTEDTEGEPKVLEPDKITNWNWFSLDNLPKPLYFPSERVIENFKQKKFYIKREKV